MRDELQSMQAQQPANMMSDLIITRAPFGMQGNSTSVARVQETQYGWPLETLFRFRQGLGRLMRRAGVQHRRLWVLDARIQNGQRNGFYGPMRRVLKRYPNTRSLVLIEGAWNLND